MTERNFAKEHYQRHRRFVIFIFTLIGVGITGIVFLWPTASDKAMLASKNIKTMILMPFLASCIVYGITFCIRWMEKDFDYIFIVGFLSIILGFALETLAFNAEVLPTLGSLHLLNLICSLVFGGFGTAVLEAFCKPFRRMLDMEPPSILDFSEWPRWYQAKFGKRLF